MKIHKPTQRGGGPSRPFADQFGSVWIIKWRGGLSKRIEPLNRIINADIATISGSDEALVATFAQPHGALAGASHPFAVNAQARNSQPSCVVVKSCLTTLAQILRGGS